MGPPPSGERLLKSLRSEANAYFPNAITLRAGDAVRFLPNGFHTVDFPFRGGSPLPFTVPTGSSSAAVDEAGRQFWFRGFDSLVVNPRLRTTTAAGIVNYDPARRRSSGLPTNDGYSPLTVRFTRPGSYKYFCNIHPGMSGVVRVLPRERRVPTSLDDRRTVTRQVRSAVASARRLLRRPVQRPGVVRIGQSGRGGVERLVFSPAALTIAKGTIVTFAVTAGSPEAHTATTGPGDPRDPASYLGGLVRSLEGPGINLVVAYPSEPTTVGTVTLTPRLHGNGFWNSGVLDGLASTPTPAQARLRFGRPGRYRIYCLLHRGMHTTVIVK